MIEINLLPVEMRQAEGTPLPRLASILGGALAATLGAVLVANYLIIDIPATRQAIKNATAEKETKEQKKKEVEAIRTDIDTIQKKVAALTNLERNRIRWARLLDYFSKCVPDGCVVRSFRIQPSGQAGDGSAGRLFKLSIQGYTSGDSYPECVKKLTDMWNLFIKEMGPPKDAKPAPAGPDVPTAAPAGGPAAAPAAAANMNQLPPTFNKFLALRFDEPAILPYRPVQLPEIPPDQMNAEQRRRYRKPALGLDFTMEMMFALPPPVQ